MPWEGGPAPAATAVAGGTTTAESAPAATIIAVATPAQVSKPKVGVTVVSLAPNAGSGGGAGTAVPASLSINALTV
jgi:hypothetical protein